MNIYSILWSVFGLVWFIGWLRTKQTLERAPLRSRLLYGLPVLVGSYLMFSDNPVFRTLQSRTIPTTPWRQALALGLTIAGLALAIWARFYLGQNWSGAVSIKVDHQLIRGGPYGWVRHPIYSGILVALIGTALARGKVMGLAAIPFFWLAFWIKSRMEEQFMRKTFGTEYLQYSRSTGALVPKLRVPRISPENENVRPGVS